MSCPCKQSREKPEIHLNDERQLSKIVHHLSRQRDQRSNNCLQYVHQTTTNKTITNKQQTPLSTFAEKSTFSASSALHRGRNAPRIDVHCAKSSFSPSSQARTSARSARARRRKCAAVFRSFCSFGIRRSCCAHSHLAFRCSK